MNNVEGFFEPDEPVREPGVSQIPKPPLAFSIPNSLSTGPGPQSGFGKVELFTASQPHAAHISE